MKRIVLGIVVSLALACGTHTPPPGPPGPALKGQLVSGGAAITASSPILLAMAWYPSFATLSPSAPPNAIVTQSVAYSGTFPISYTFSISDPPPASALADLTPSGGTGHIAYGVLIAYEDRNGNGQLDAIPDGGAPIDNIVGLSVADPSLPPPAHTYYVVYLDGTVGPTDYFAPFALVHGYNLLTVHHDYGIEPAPLDTSIPIAVTGSTGLNIYACPQAFDSVSFFQRACGIDPYDGKYQAQGDITDKSGASPVEFGELWINDASGGLGGATVTVDSNAWPYDSGQASYNYTAAPSASGSHTVNLAVPGYSPEVLTYSMPAAISVSSPTTGATFHSGSTVPISWGATTGADFYDIYFVSSDGAWLYHALTTATSVTTPAITFTGNASLSVKAIGPMAVGSQGSFITPLSSQRVSVVFTP